MKISLSLTFSLSLLFMTFKVYAQPADGSIASDFTIKDINLKSHNLYSNLDSGKAVIINYFYTTCKPRWDHHHYFEANTNQYA